MGSGQEPRIAVDPQATPLDVSNYRIVDVDRIPTPSVCVYPELVAKNIDRAIHLAGGDPSRLRPHVKTHKTIEVVRMQLDRGIRKHKCATLREARLLVDAGARDVLIAYPMVGPNIARFADLVAARPDVDFSVVADHPLPVESLSQIMRQAQRDVRVLVDVDCGMGRTGVLLGPEVVNLYRRIAASPGLRPGGLHVYDGHNDQPDPRIRGEEVAHARARLRELIAELKSNGLPVPRVVVGGSGSFHLWLDQSPDDPLIEGSPGTFVFSDWNYHRRFADYGMTPAAVALTRVVSKPRPNRLTFDLGHKAVAADTLAPQRVWFFELTNWEFVRQSEEHLVIDTAEADRFSPGDVLYTLPYHVCPTIALHRDLYVVENHRLTGRWPVAARDRDR